MRKLLIAILSFNLFVLNLHSVDKNLRDALKDLIGTFSKSVRKQSNAYDYLKDLDNATVRKISEVQEKLITLAKADSNLKIRVNLYDSLRILNSNTFFKGKPENITSYINHIDDLIEARKALPEGSNNFKEIGKLINGSLSGVKRAMQARIGPIAEVAPLLKDNKKVVIEPQMSKYSQHLGEGGLNANSVSNNTKDFRQFVDHVVDEGDAIRHIEIKTLESLDGFSYKTKDGKLFHYNPVEKITNQAQTHIERMLKESGDNIPLDDLLDSSKYPHLKHIIYHSSIPDNQLDDLAEDIKDSVYTIIDTLAESKKIKLDPAKANDKLTVTEREKLINKYLDTVKFKKINMSSDAI